MAINGQNIIKPHSVMQLCQTCRKEPICKAANNISPIFIKHTGSSGTDKAQNHIVGGKTGDKTSRPRSGVNGRNTEAMSLMCKLTQRSKNQGAGSQKVEGR